MTEFKLELIHSKHVSDIWKWFDSRYKVHCLNKETRELILSWSGCDPAGVYYYLDGHLEYDVLISAKHLARVKRLMADGSKTSQRPKTTGKVAVE